MDTKMTVDVIREMADSFRRSAKELDGVASDVEKSGNFDDVGCALSTVTSCFNGLRLDLLATRPVREMSRLIKENSS